MNENCCLCKFFTELHFFYWLLVVSCNFNRFAFYFQSFINIACRSTQNAERIKRFLRLHIVIKTLNKKNKHNKCFIMLKRNSFNVHCKFGACQKWELAGRVGDFGNFLNGFAKSPRVRRTVLNIERVQFVLKNCEILHFVWGLYDKNSASYNRKILFAFQLRITLKVHTQINLTSGHTKEDKNKEQLIILTKKPLNK